MVGIGIRSLPWWPFHWKLSSLLAILELWCFMSNGRNGGSYCINWCCWLIRLCSFRLEPIICHRIFNIRKGIIRFLMEKSRILCCCISLVSLRCLWSYIRRCVISIKHRNCDLIISLNKWRNKSVWNKLENLF